ncbi:AAA family ATPase, partial [Halobium palmae]
MTDWTEKYRPSTLSEVRGNDSARDEFEEWARSWDDHRKAVVLHGSPGVGKTSAAHALAADMGWETVELNAS